MTFDVAIIGGAFSGASTALLLKRRNPSWRILIIEKAVEFDRKVGESTTEVSSCFLTRVLGLTNYLGHHQLPKQGLRMWFTKSEDQPFDSCTEIGARYNSRLPGFQVDRSTLDEHVLKLAVEAGCELLRPAKVSKLDLGGIGRNSLEVLQGDDIRQVTARWVVDASGRVAVIARKQKYLKPLEEHPINALWARFTGVKDWDGVELRQKYPKWAEATKTARGWATNHLVGLGWWCWIIPLKGGDVSVGLVYDTRLFTPPEGGSIGERLQAHFRGHPVGLEILGDAQPVVGDQKAYSALPYVSERIAGEGWVMAGDAAGFIDPLYSPGLDFCSFTAQGAATLVGNSLEDMDISEDITSWNARYSFCYRAWFESIYQDKYYYLGDAELMAAAFLHDIASYHLGPVRQVYSDPSNQFNAFPFDGVPGRIVHRAMRFFNQRLTAVARRKLAAGVYGDRNSDWRLLVPGFLPDASAGKLLCKAFVRLAIAELRSARAALFMKRPRASVPELAGAPLVE